jgi:single-stranded DNA-binding protein
MSAFILPTKHIAALTSYANYRKILRQKPERVFEILTEENYASENPLWFKVECWGNLAETVGNYLSKGRLVARQSAVRLKNEHFTI